MTRVGLIEDNEDLRDDMAFQLSSAGFVIALQGDGRDIDAQLQVDPCDLLVLDLGLPAEDGLSIAQRLRERYPALGIVMVTARGAIDARVDGLVAGADAYLVKPVDIRELVAVLRSVERRTGLAQEPETRAEIPASWRLYLRSLTLCSPSGNMVVVTPREAALLAALAEAGSTPATRRQLVQILGESDPDADERRLEVAVSRLRQKIGEADPGAEVIRAVRNQGYLFTAPLRVDA